MTPCEKARGGERPSLVVQSQIEIAVAWTREYTADPSIVDHQVLAISIFNESGQQLVAGRVDRNRSIGRSLDGSIFLVLVMNRPLSYSAET